MRAWRAKEFAAIFIKKYKENYFIYATSDDFFGLYK
jgi:hypothetical protein